MLHCKGHRPLFLVVVVFAAMIAIVNPFRELLTQDDGWAYARSVKHLLDTGEYRVDAWAAPNTAVQIYLAAGLARIFGYSLSLLRISTLLLFLCGAIAFYRLLYESGSDSALAAALTLALICSPIVLLLSFTFMTDVQFLGWMLIACWLNARGLRRRSAAALLLGGLAAALAIGTRQFGVALPAGLAFSWILAGRSNRPRGTVILAALAIPSAAFLWQLWAARDHPTFAQSVTLVEQWQYLRQTVPSLLLVLLWRTTVFVEYAGLYLAALLPGLLVLLYQRRTLQGVESSRSFVGIFLWAGYLIAGHLLGATLAQGGPWNRLRDALVPSIPWIIGTIMPGKFRYQLVLTALGLASAALLGWLLFPAAAVKAALRRRDAVTCFFVGTACAFAVLHLLYIYLFDTYLIVFLPFVLFALSQVLKAKTTPRACIRAIALASAILGIGVAFWMRGNFNRQEAIWRASDQIHAAGVDMMQIRGSFQWLEYHSAFDEWLIHLGPRARPQDYAGPYWRPWIGAPFYAWLDERQKHAEYLVYSSDWIPETEGYSIVERLAYRDSFLRQRFVYVMKRSAA